MRVPLLLSAVLGMLVGSVRPLEETFVASITTTTTTTTTTIRVAEAVAVSEAVAANTSNPTVSNSCVTFQVGAGTGCDWMCNYCANQLGTANYYFTTDVCRYETGGCVGNPQPTTPYTCCSA